MAPISQRRAIAAVAILLSVLLFFGRPDFFSTARPPPQGRSLEAQTILEPPNVEYAKFNWSNVEQRYPVSSFIPMPSGKTDIPAIQHIFPAEEDAQARATRLARLETVKKEFLHAWTGYKKYAWLNDEVAPISGGSKNPFGGWAATLVDSLDTLWIMDLKDEFEEAVAAIGTIDFSTCALDDLNLFETTIRYLGGFLSAYDLSGGKYPALLQKAEDMGQMLYKAFDTPNRMPMTRWNLKRAAAGAPQVAPEAALSAEVGSLTLEFTRLCQLTNDTRYFDAVQRIMDIFDAQQNNTKLPGMWGVIINTRDLDFTDYGTFTIGGMADSLYEYLPKQYMLLGGASDQYRKLYENAASPMKKHLLYRPMTPEEADILVPGDVQTNGIGPRSAVHLEPKNQHLSCFAGGMFAIAGKIFSNPEDVEVGRKITEGCLWAYEASPQGIMPEIMYTMPCDDATKCPWDEGKWKKAVEKANYGQDKPIDTIIEEKHLTKGIIKVQDRRYILRPEAIESTWILYRITGDESLRERAWGMFERIIKHTKTPIAHAALGDCLADEPTKSDSMESFWLAETLKYFYLLFADHDLVSLDEYVLNTEAHPLRRPT